MRIVTYNIAFGRWEQIDDLHDILADTDADIIALNEADQEDVVIELARRLGLHHVWARGSGDRHIATLSRYPIQSWTIHNRKPLTQAALATTLDYAPLHREPLTVYNVHLRPDPFWHAEILRWLAVGRLLGIVRADRPGPHLIVGDFNTYAPGDPVDVATILRTTSPGYRRMLRLQRNRFLRIALQRLLDAGYTDCFRKLHPDDPGYTFMRFQQPVNRMDFILADRRLAPRLRCCSVLDVLPQTAFASDHYPVMAEFETAVE